MLQRRMLQKSKRGRQRLLPLLRRLLLTRIPGLSDVSSGTQRVTNAMREIREEHVTGPRGLSVRQRSSSTFVVRHVRVPSYIFIRNSNLDTMDLSRGTLSVVRLPWVASQYFNFHTSSISTRLTIPAAFASSTRITHGSLSRHSQCRAPAMSILHWFDSNRHLSLFTLSLARPAQPRPFTWDHACCVLSSSYQPFQPLLLS